MAFLFETEAPETQVVPGGVQAPPTDVPGGTGFLFETSPSDPVKANLESSITKSPDTEAKQQTLAKESGHSVETVKANEKEIINRREVDTSLSELQNAPATAKYVSVPGNADVSSDDLRPLAQLERTIGALADFLITRDDIGRDVNIGRQQTRRNLAAASLRLNRTPEARARFEAENKELEAQGPASTGGLQGILAPASQVVGQQIETVTDPALAAKVGIGGAIGTAVSGPAGTIPGMIAGGVTHLVQTAYLSEGGESYASLIELGASEEVATNLSVMVGTANAALEMASLGLLAKPFTAAFKDMVKEAIKKVALTPSVIAAAAKTAGLYGGIVVTEGLTEGVQEFTKIQAEEFAKEFEGLDHDSITEAELTERLTQSFLQAMQAQAVLALPGAGVQFQHKTMEVKRAKEARNIMQQVAAEMQETATFERSQDLAAEHMEGVLAEVGVDQVYIPADKFVEWLSTEPNGQEIIDAMGIEEQLETGIALGHDIEVGGLMYARHILASPNYDGIADHLRMNISAMTAEEADTFLNDDFKNEVEALAAQGILATDIAPNPFLVKQGKEDTPIIEVPLDTVLESLTDNNRRMIEAQSQEDAGFIGKLADTIGQEGIHTALAAKRLPNGQLDIGDGLHRIAAAQQLGLESVPIQIENENPAMDLAERELGLKSMVEQGLDVGMTPKQVEAHLVKVQKASEEGANRLEDARLAKEQKELTNQFKAEQERVTEEIEEHLKQTVPAYMLVNDIQNVRLDREILSPIVKELGFTLDDLPKQSKGRRIYNSHKTEEKIDPELYAQRYGFDSALDMVWQLIATPSFTDAVKGQVDVEMQSRGAEIKDARSEVIAAREALHNNSQAAVIRDEMNALRTAQKQKRISAKLIKLAAKAQLAKLSLKELKPIKFMEAAARAGKAAGKALKKGDRESAMTLKTQQVISFEMAKEAIRQQKHIERERTHLRKLQVKPDVSYAVRFQKGISNLLDQSNFQKKLSPKELATQKKLLNDRANPIKIQERLLRNELPNVNDMTLETFQQLVDQVKAIEHAGKKEQKLRNQTEAEDLELSVSEVNEAVIDNLLPGSKKKGHLENASKWEKAKKAVDSYRLLLFHMDSLVEKVDGMLQGPMYRATKERYDDAMARGYNSDRNDRVGYLLRSQEVAQAIEKLYSVYTAREKQNFHAKKFVIPGVGIVTKEKMLSVMLNSGNAVNIESMTESNTVTAEEIKAIQDFADKRDWDFVQSVWDYMDGYWDEVVVKQQFRDNTTPTRVESQAIETKHGTYKGGYYPIKYDPEKSHIFEKQEQKDAYEDMKQGNFASSMTNRDHTKERAKARNGNAVALDLFVINKHLDDMVYDLEVGDALYDAFKILHNTDVVQAFNAADSHHVWEQMDLWLRDVVTGEIGINGAVEKGLRALRSGITVSALGWNVGVIGLQPLGILQTGVQIGHRNMMYGVRMTMTEPWVSRGDKVGISDAASAESTVMATRMSNYNKDIADALTQLKATLTGKISPDLAAFIEESWFWGIKKTQRWADLVTYYGAKRDGMKKFKGDEKKAIKHAEQMITRTQSSGVFGNRSALERGSYAVGKQQTEAIRIFTTFASYFIAKFNVASARVGRTNKRNPIALAGMLGDLMVLYTFEAVLASIIRGQWPEDDDEIAGHVATETFSSIVGQFPIIREIFAGVQGFSGGGTVAALSEDVKKAYEQALQGEADPALFKALNTLGGLKFGYGSSQLNKTGETLYEVISNGEDVEAIEYAMGYRK